MNNFATLEDIFTDPDFEGLVAGIKTAPIERVDPEIEKFMEIIDWVKVNGREPQKTLNMKERSLFSRLKGIRSNEERLTKLLAYDTIGLLGEGHD
ncbi:hypothetical protein [Streptococcus thoraltensis]|uniref:hypothetical protein n=1 Tax=Streptococcus thoraltensis TaxID=55085 RepID=UPI00039ABA0D|nr:hypothetical protein [Streptococcus thoraltensis]MDY4762293.1 hypothetical protein [Streptococcus thoraltensis]